MNQKTRYLLCDSNLVKVLVNGIYELEGSVLSINAGSPKPHIREIWYRCKHSESELIEHCEHDISYVLKLWEDKQELHPMSSRARQILLKASDRIINLRGY